MIFLCRGRLRPYFCHNFVFKLILTDTAIFFRCYGDDWLNPTRGTIVTSKLERNMNRSRSHTTNTALAAALDPGRLAHRRESRRSILLCLHRITGLYRRSSTNGGQRPLLGSAAARPRCRCVLMPASLYRLMTLLEFGLANGAEVGVGHANREPARQGVHWSLNVTRAHNTRCKRCRKLRPEVRVVESL